VSLLHTPSTGMAWVGLESSAMAISTGSAGNVGAHIVFIDSDHQVDIQVASADTIRIHNAAVSTRTGNVTLVW
jgi:hypothetical protein